MKGRMFGENYMWRQKITAGSRNDHVIQSPGTAGKRKFSGTTVCIPYGLDVKGLSAGETVDAVITINSNLGEYQVPVHAEITDDFRDSDIPRSSG